MARVVQFEGRQISVPDDATDDEVASIIGASAPAHEAPVDPGEAADIAAGGMPVTKGQHLIKNNVLGFEQGVGNFLANAAQPAIAAGKALGIDMSGFEKGQTGLRNPEHDPGVTPGGPGRLVADTMMTTPLAAVFPAGFLGTTASGATGGALTANAGHQGTAAALGAGGGGLLHMLSRAIAPIVSPSVQRLAAADVQMTPGQIFGGWLKGVEDRVAGLPVVGDWIREAQNRSLQQAGRGAFNQFALGPVNQELPPGVFGQDAVRQAGDALSDNYNQLLPQMTARLDAPFVQEITGAGDRVAARLPDEMGGQFQGTLADIFKKLNSTATQPSNRFAGEAAHEAASDAARMGRSYTPQGGNEGELGQAYNTVSQAFRSALNRSNPQLAPELAANDRGWSNLVPLESAAEAAGGNSAGKAPGVFTGYQLRNAVRQADTSVRGRAVARGEAPMQQYAEDMIQVLPQSVGDSGTAGRWLLPALATGAAPFSAPAAVSAAAIPAIYSRPGLAVINRLYAHGAGPGATALGGMMQNLGRYGAGPAAGTFTRGDQ